MIIADRWLSLHPNRIRSLRRRLGAHGTAADRHALWQRAARDAEAALDQVLAQATIERKAVGIDPEGHDGERDLRERDPDATGGE